MSGLEITDCRVRPCAPGQGDEKLCAFATITLNNAFVVCDLKVINGNDGVFVAMPSRRRKDGTFRDIAHPLNADTRLTIERVVLREYLRELERAGAPMPSLPAHLTLEDLRAAPGTSPDLYRPAALGVLADHPQRANGSLAAAPDEASTDRAAAGVAAGRPPCCDDTGEAARVVPDLDVPSRAMPAMPQPAVVRDDRLDADLID